MLNSEKGEKMLPPYLELLESQIDEIIKQINISYKTCNFSWFVKRGIEVYNKGYYWLLGIIENSTINHWNRLCTGMVIKKPVLSGDLGSLVSFPVFKLNKINDPDCCIEYRNADLVQKIRGDRVCVFWPLNTYAEGIFPEIRVYHTDKEISSTIGDSQPNSILRKARSILRDLKFCNLDTQSSYTFEICEGKPYLVGSCHVKSLYESTENELDLIARRLKAFRPATIKCISRDCLKKVKGLFIVRDSKTGERANVYLPILRQKVVSKCRFKRLIPFWLKGTHEQIIAQIPEAKAKYDQIEFAFYGLKTKIKNYSLPWHNAKLSQEGLCRSLETSSAPKWSIKIITRLMKFNMERWDEVITNWFKKMPPKQAINILGLTEPS